MKLISSIVFLSGIVILWKWEIVLWSLAKLVLNAFGVFPFYKVGAVLCRLHAVERCKFMNYGYTPLTDEDLLALSPMSELITKEPIEDRNSIQLYERVLSLCPKYPTFDKLDILEIGCGHGGGVDWIARSRSKIKRIRGMDMVVVNTFDDKVFQGDATNIALANHSIDIIVNVESSHSYNDQQAFFAHCHRILKPGGYLLWADIRNMTIHNEMKGMMMINEIVDFMDHKGFEKITQLDIAKNVVKSLSLDYKNAHAQWESIWYLKLFLPLTQAIWARPGTPIYEQLDNGEGTYHAICWQK